MDILSFFMEKVDRNGQPFTDAYLQDIVMNFIIAGLIIYFFFLTSTSLTSISTKIL